MFDRLVAAARNAEAEGADSKVTALALFDRGQQAEPAYILGRGSVTNRQESVALGFLQVLTRGTTPADYLAQARASAASCVKLDEPDAMLGTTYQRMALAGWLTDLDHGAGALLARVVVNRLWQHHFGEGLVRTPDDFRHNGLRVPTIPSCSNGWQANSSEVAGGSSQFIGRSSQARSIDCRQQTLRPAWPLTPTIVCSGTAERSGWRPRPCATRCSPRVGVSTR